MKKIEALAKFLGIETSGIEEGEYFIYRLN